MLELTLSSTVGMYTVPLRFPPHKSSAPPVMALFTLFSTSIAAVLVIKGSTSVSGSIGSPVTSF